MVCVMQNLPTQACTHTDACVFSHCVYACMCTPAGCHDILKPYDSDGMAAQLYFTADAPQSRFFRSWDLDLVMDVLQVRV